MEIPARKHYEVARISGLEPPVTPTGTNTPKPVRPDTKIDKGPKEEGKDQRQTGLGQVPLQLDDRGGDVRMRAGQESQKGQENA